MFGANFLMGEKFIRSMVSSNLPVAAYSRPVMSPDNRPTPSTIIATPYRISSLSARNLVREVLVREIRLVVIYIRFLRRDITISHPPILEVTRLGRMFEGLVEVSHWQSMIGDASNFSLILDVNNIGGDDTFLMFAQPSLTNDVGFPQ